MFNLPILNLQLMKMGATKIINYNRLYQAIGYITEHYKEQPDLNKVASAVYMSPFHFQKLFIDWVGLSPKKFVQFLSINYLRQRIQDTQNMIDAADEVGFSSQSRVHDLFISIEGVSPQQYKSGGKGLELFYGYHASPFGLCFIAVTEKGVAELRFIDEEVKRNEYQLFSDKWHFAKLSHRPDITQNYIHDIFKPTREHPEKLHLIVQGSPFKIKVWEALVNIPFGEVRSYQQVAEKLGCPHALRAVASAAGKNPISYLIPCHRIITKNGNVGHFHYGKVRKQAMIGWEMAILSKNE
jgi:AraC family transcriptional regulator, regulatory protein of adaptative response / methylated-DNA-[protein]-cysteine methyltransferase